MWSTWVAQAFQFGIDNGDSIWYHLPIAARFVQNGSIAHLHYLNGEALVTYYPANASLLHAFGFLAFGRDDLSLLLNFAALPVALLAGWCIGERHRAAPATLTGVAVILALPIIAATQPGSAKDDVLGLTFFLAAVAFALHADGRKPALGLSGMAAGLAIGTKLTLLVPVLILAVAIVGLGVRNRQRAATGVWLAGMLATGSYWYLRNLIAVGNPVPGLALRLGPIRLPSPPTPSLDRFGPAVGEFLTNHNAWSSTFQPGLQNAFGPAWPAVLAMALSGAIAAIWRARGVERAVGLSAIAATIAFLVTPGTAFAVGVINAHSATGIALSIFAYNLRYLIPALAVGVALLASVPALTRGTARWLVLGAFATVLLVTEASNSGLRGWASNQAPVAALSMLGTLTLFVIFGSGRGHIRSSLVRRAEPRKWRLVVGLVVASAILVGGAAVSRSYHRDRYAANPLAAWARRVHHQRVAFAGFDGQYPLIGDDLSNYVQYLGVHRGDGAFASFQNCLAWRRSLRSDHYQYVVTPTNVTTRTLGYDLARWKLGRPDGEPPSAPLESEWNRTDPGLRRVYERGGATVYRIQPVVSAAGCP
jgi:hypothetical protein